MRKEQAARDELVGRWPKFAAADKSYCVEISTPAHEPSYAALLTCLELMQEARNARSRSERGTTAQRGGSAAPAKQMPVRPLAHAERISAHGRRERVGDETLPGRRVQRGSQLGVSVNRPPSAKPTP